MRFKHVALLYIINERCWLGLRTFSDLSVFCESSTQRDGHRGQVITVHTAVGSRAAHGLRRHGTTVNAVLTAMLWTTEKTHKIPSFIVAIHLFLHPMMLCANYGSKGHCTESKIFVRIFHMLNKYVLTLCQLRLHTASETFGRHKKIRIRFDFLRFRIRNKHFDRKGWRIYFGLGVQGS